MRPARLITRLFPAFMLVTLLSLGSALLYAEHAVRVFHENQTALELEAELQLLRDTTQAQLGDEAVLQRFLGENGRRTDTRYTLIAPDGRVLADSQEDPARMENHATRPEVLAARAGQVSARATRFSATRLETLLYTATLVGTNGDARPVLRAARPIKGLNASLRALEWQMALVALLIFALAALASYLLARRIARPLQALRVTAEHYAAGDLAQRPPLSDIEEVAALAEAMKTMARQLDERIQLLSHERAESEAVLASMIEGVLAVNNTEAIIRLNRAAAQLIGATPEQATGRDLREVVRHPVLQEFTLAALTSDAPIEKDMLLYAPDERHVAAHGTALRNAAGKRIGALVVLNDVTRIRRLENIQREFVANVSHELKTPITAIQGFVETLLGGEQHRPEDVHRFLEIVSRHTERLNSIIEDLLALSRIEQEESNSLEREAADLRDIAAAAIPLCRAHFNDKDIAIENRCAEPMPACVNTRLVEQALVNLLNNAVKFSPAGRLVIIEGAREGIGWKLSVHDQGCGIAA
ncbi:MAG: PAS domain-containing protein, partial [Kiritimatiellaeota bacterium]|nr:PAS domain-containing protein [Kiritimatiellota bacterium]